MLIAPHCALLNRGEHTFDSVGQSVFEAPRKRSEKIVIGNDVWIGYGCIILGGCTIGDGVIIAAGSLVLEDIPPYSIAAGNPAKVVKRRFSDADVLKHRRLLEGRKHAG